MRVGIIGFGKMGMLHGALLHSIENVELVAITDTSKFVLNGFKSLFPNIRVFTSYEKMIDSCDLHAVIIATPSFNHVSIAKYALERGLDLFIEKPLSNTLKDCKELLQLAQNRNAVVMIGFCMRYNPMFAKGKEIVDSRIVGDIIKADAYIYCSDVLSQQSGWRFDPAISGGGVLIDFAVHMVDLLYHYFGNASAVSGNISSVYSRQVEDETTAELYFQSGLQATLHASWSKPEYRKPFYKIEIAGSLGSLSITDQDIQLNVGGIEKTYYPEHYEGYYIDIGGPHFSKQMESFVKSVQTRQEPKANLTAGLHTQNIINAIYTSAATGKRQAVSEDDTL
ncbi:Gfo/Idh/MocA family oxidoreductase [Paenibacillus doosanensis]|uniref:Gfo/Idh/MocA family protein n=1 Tax=Paenibacillus doosanensis TaxID=1229154 RepID=UPI00217F85D9|nr:Gfo/Idh/MocA family oxidoreductase [Paenibacillus doosanensis]MCS7462975.1 Gfo/Idh/MocA family oxidoreductase [Paenibacillus doosanensis]